MSHRLSCNLTWALIASFTAAALPTLANASPVTGQVLLSPIPVSLDLDTKDKDSKAFSDALTQAISNDPRFELTDPLPVNGLKVIMTDGVKPGDDDSRLIEAYEVDLKLQSGKYVGAATGYCDRDKIAMCGRVVAEDTYNAYVAFMSKTKP